MLEEHRSYRKNLNSHGLIYLAGKELNISVKNLSITGLLAELEINDLVTDSKDVFDFIKTSPVIDFYLPEMRLAGEAELVREDLSNDGHITLALEFRNLSYDIDHLLYKRQAYRKNMTAVGHIVFNGCNYDFFTKNVSVDGMMILVNEFVNIEAGTVTVFDFKHLDLEGEIKVAWIEHIEGGSTLMGLHYEQLSKEKVEGIPRFARPTKTT